MFLAASALSKLRSLFLLFLTQFVFKARDPMKVTLTCDCPCPGGSAVQREISIREDNQLTEQVLEILAAPAAPDITNVLVVVAMVAGPIVLTEGPRRSE